MCGAATAKARLPTVDSLTGGTARPRLALVEVNGVFVDQASRRHGSSDRGSVVHRWLVGYIRSSGVMPSNSRPLATTVLAAANISSRLCAQTSTPVIATDVSENR